MATTMQLIAEIAEDARKLFHQEIDLVKAELTLEFQRLKNAVILTVIASATITVALGLLAITMVQVLMASTHLPSWACYAIGFGIFAAASLLLVLLSLRVIQNLNLAPKETLQSVKDNVRFFKTVELSTESEN